MLYHSDINYSQWQRATTGLDNNDGVAFPIAFPSNQFVCSVSANQGYSDWVEGGGFDYTTSWTNTRGYYSCWRAAATAVSQLNNLCHIINIGI